MYQTQISNSFKKDIKLAKKRGLNMNKLKEIIILLEAGKKLPEKSRDHVLTGNWKNYRECHVEPDWLLIYKISDNVLNLARTGTHSDLF
jgi:mRNA interferase YafQ